ncbi:hypothetical protein WAF17_11565 [Bernardetia sp. ABR2-2B]|uniref:hypothetical protein n=1 Tax=Bernardetia sp. ABR2-2B TaxID=3127472 RepID=UPI0030D4644E
MNKRYRFFAIAFFCCFCFFGNSFFANAQVDTGDVIESDDDLDFDMDGFEEADDTVIKQYCNNKINNLNPTTLVGLSYDFMFGAELESTNPDDSDSTFSYNSPISLNQGIRLDANVPLVSKSNIILNATFSYWESRYNFDQVDTRDPLAVSLNNNGLRTATLGVLAFKPLDEKHFLIFQAATSLNGNYTFGTYDFGEVEPDFGKMKYTASLLYGWKKSDNQNIAVGLTRTYRGGRLLHIPIFLWNKTFNSKWGMELLLPARGGIRYNFSALSSINFGYELEGQSYLLQNSPSAPDLFATNNYELRKSEIRGRIMLNQALSSFIRLNIQAGVAPAYRFDLEDDGSNDGNQVSVGSLGLPMYFRIGLNFVSP